VIAKFAMGWLLIGSALTQPLSTRPEVRPPVAIHQHVDAEIPASCIHKLIMQHCDASGDRLTCKSAHVEWGPESCAILHIVKE
jgi:hypothetical protein